MAFFPNRRPYIPCIPMLPVVADLESPINGHDRALATAHAFGDRRDSEIGFRQQVSNSADLHFRQAPAPSIHRSHLPHSNSSVAARMKKSIASAIDFQRRH